MKSKLKMCKECKRYTLCNVCPYCGSATYCPVPYKYSPQDHMGKYRRETILNVCGENGKYNKV